MESLSVSTHRGLIHWQRMLLLVSLLTFWSLPTTEEMRVVPTFATEGQDVLLRIHNKPPEAIGIVWYKAFGADPNNVIAFFMMTSGIHLSGPGNNGVEMITEDGSLLLKNVTVNDTGTYTVVVHVSYSESYLGVGKLEVYEALRTPILEAIKNGGKQKRGFILNCSTNAPSIQWLFNDRNLSLKNRMKLSEDGRTLTINPVLKEDAGVYQCKAQNPVMEVVSRGIKLILPIK